MMPMRRRLTWDTCDLYRANPWRSPERGARLARRDDGTYRQYSTEEQRSQAGWTARPPVLIRPIQATRHDEPAIRRAGEGDALPVSSWARFVPATRGPVSARRRLLTRTAKTRPLCSIRECLVSDVRHLIAGRGIAPGCVAPQSQMSNLLLRRALPWSGRGMNTTPGIKQRTSEAGH